MEWSRIKTIILMILVVTNVSLLGFLVQRELQIQNARQEARQNSIQFLENNGVTVDDEVVPEEMTLLPQTVEWDREQERESASVLLGGEVQEQAWSDEIYRYYNEAGSIQFHRDGTFQGEFVEGAFQLEGQDAAAYSLQVLEILGIQGESLSVQADSGEEDAVTVVCRQLWNQVPVFNHLITLTFRGDSLAAVEGHTGVMVGFKRKEGREYGIETFLIPIEEVMMVEKTVPDTFINAEGNDVTEAFTEWCRPLIGPELRDFVDFQSGNEGDL